VGDNAPEIPARMLLENKRMASGTVKWFNATKGYGFISPAGGGSDVFVHITAVQAAGLQGLKDGQQISYELAEERGKTSAVNLKAS
jgi:CspA family cold shock protein